MEQARYGDVGAVAKSGLRHAHRRHWRPNGRPHCGVIQRTRGLALGRRRAGCAGSIAGMRAVTCGRCKRVVGTVKGIGLATMTIILSC